MQGGLCALGSVIARAARAPCDQGPVIKRAQPPHVPPHCCRATGTVGVQGEDPNCLYKSPATLRTVRSIAPLRFTAAGDDVRTPLKLTQYLPVAGVVPPNHWVPRASRLAIVQQAPFVPSTKTMTEAGAVGVPAAWGTQTAEGPVPSASTPLPGIGLQPLNPPVEGPTLFQRAPSPRAQRHRFLEQLRAQL